MSIQASPNMYIKELNVKTFMSPNMHFEIDKYMRYNDLSVVSHVPCNESIMLIHV